MSTSKPSKATTPPTAPDEPKYTDRPPYEEARDELIAIVARLEGGEPGLEESLTLWERGEHLAAVCQDWLDGAQQRLDAARPEDQDDTGDSA
jgi:exodeoxyribonuclease VII small subunit